MASAPTAKNDTSARQAEPLPAGFTSPFKRVPMEGRIDDALACIATLTGHTLAEVNAEAMAVGFPAHGPAILSEDQIAALCMKLGNLVTTKWKEWKGWAYITSDVAIMYVDVSETMELGRHVVYHSVHATPQRRGFKYLVDPAFFVPAERHMTTSIDLVVPEYYIGISRASGGTVKPTAAGKKA